MFNTYLHANMWKEKNMMWSVSIRKPFQMALNTSVGNDSIDWKVRSERKIDLTARRRGINGMPNRFFTLSHSLNNDVRLNAVLCRYSKYHKNIHSSIKCNELSHSCSFTPHSRRDFTSFFCSLWLLWKPLNLSTFLINNMLIDDTLTMMNMSMCVRDLRVKS